MQNFYAIAKNLTTALVLVVIWALGMQQAQAVTCATAPVVTLPVSSQALVCGTTNDIIAANGTQCAGAVVSGTGSTFYLGGTEAMYTFTPTSSGSITITLSTTQTWTGIWLFNGCPGSAGVCVVAVTTSTTGGTTTSTVNVTAGTQYYVVFDTWPAPPTPCAAGATFSITAPPVAPVGCLTAVNGLFPATTFTPTCTGTAQNITTCGFGSEYSNVNVVTGNSYTFTSSVTTDYITISDAAGTITYIAGTTPINWTATITGTVRFYTHTNSACGAASACRTKSVSCTVPIPGCLTAVNGLFPAATFTPTCTGTAQTITTCGYGSEYSNVNVVSGNIYTFTSSVTTDFITISDAAGTTVLASGTTPVTWTANTTGTIRFYTHTNSACGAASVCRTKSVSCTVSLSGCLTAVNGLFPAATFTPTCPGGAQNITTCGFGSEYSNVNVVSGNIYTFTSSVTTDFITISDAAGTTVLASGTTPVTWTANTTGTIRFYTHTNSACGAASVCRTKSVSCSSNPDFCTGAIPITCGTPVSGTTVGFTTDAVGTCVTALNTAPGLWYSLAGFNGEVTASLCGSAYDTKIGVFTGSCGALTCLTGNDDFNCGGVFTTQSQVTFSTVAGTTYYILVTGFSANAGAFTLNTTCTTCAAPTGVTVTGVTATTATVNWNCVGCTGSFIVEYGPAATFTTPGTGATAGVGGTVVTAAGSPALLTGLTAGTQYRVFVRQNCAGSFSNNTTGVLFNTPPANDNVCSAIPLVLGANPPYTNAGATTEAGEPVPPGIACSVQNGWCAGQTVSNSVWFTLVGPPSGRVTVSSTGFDNQLAIYSAASCAAVLSGGATLLAANDDFNPGFAASLNNVCVTPGVTYFVQMDGYSTSTGTATITVIEVPNTPPTIAGCPANITSCSPLVSWTAPTANDPDGCGTPTLTGTHTPGSVFAPGLTTVTYTATDHAGATATCSFTVNVATITASVSSVSNYNGFGVSCNGGNNGSATVTASGGTGLTYNWSNGATGATANGLSAGNYTVVVSNAQGCSQTLLVSITQPTAVTCSASSTNVGCNDAATGTASASATGGIGPYTFNWSNGATGANISGLAAGSYSVTVADANGCVCTRTVTITQPTAVQLVSEGVVVDGSGGSFYSVYQIVVTGGTLPYNIAFTSAGGFATYTVNNGLVDTDGNGTPDAPGSTINVTYQNEAQWTLILDDANGCVAGAGLVFSNAGPNALLNIASAAIVADSGTGNGSISIVASGGTPTCPGYNYQWSGPSNWLGASVNSPNISNLPSGWYIVVVTDCSGEQTYAWYWVPKQTRGRGKLAQGETIMAYPNPVNSQTTIEFSLDVTAKTTVSVYALDGKEVAQLYNGTAEAGELYTIPFDVTYLPNGVYMATLRTDNGFTQQIKLTVMH